MNREGSDASVLLLLQLSVDEPLYKLTGNLIVIFHNNYASKMSVLMRFDNQACHKWEEFDLDSLAWQKTGIPGNYEWFRRESGGRQ